MMDKRENQSSWMDDIPASMRRSPSEITVNTNSHTGFSPENRGFSRNFKGLVAAGAIAIAGVMLTYDNEDTVSAVDQRPAIECSGEKSIVVPTGSNLDTIVGDNVEMGSGVYISSVIEKEVIPNNDLGNILPAGATIVIPKYCSVEG